MREAKEQLLLSNPHTVLYDTAAKHAPTGRVRVRSPARLSTEMNMAIRDAAAKAFVVSSPPFLPPFASLPPPFRLF